MSCLNRNVSEKSLLGRQVVDGQSTWLRVWGSHFRPVAELRCGFASRQKRKNFLTQLGSLRWWLEMLGMLGGRWARVRCEKIQFKLNICCSMESTDSAKLDYFYYLDFRKLSHVSHDPWFLIISHLYFSHFFSFSTSFAMFQGIKFLPGHGMAEFVAVLPLQLKHFGVSSCFPPSQWSHCNDEIPLFVCHIWRMAHGLLGG